MAVNDSLTTSATASGSSFQMTEDRYCPHCTEISLAYDPAASQPRCRACGRLAQ